MPEVFTATVGSPGASLAVAAVEVAGRDGYVWIQPEGSPRGLSVSPRAVSPLSAKLVEALSAALRGRPSADRLELPWQTLVVEAVADGRIAVRDPKYASHRASVPADAVPALVQALAGAGACLMSRRAEAALSAAASGGPQP